MTINDLKTAIRKIGRNYPDREQRARRLFIEERAASLHAEREREFAIRTEISEFFAVPYAAVSFCGSGQLGLSVHKDKLFAPGVSDLDAAIIDVNLYQHAWRDVIETTRAFSDLSRFGRASPAQIDLFQQQILRRGMIRIDAMPQSANARSWSTFQNTISLKHTIVFRNITLAIYMNEYAFCWKQDSAITALIR